MRFRLLIFLALFLGVVVALGLVLNDKSEETVEEVTSTSTTTTSTTTRQAMIRWIVSSTPNAAVKSVCTWKLFPQGHRKMRPLKTSIEIS